MRKISLLQISRSSTASPSHTLSATPSAISNTDFPTNSLHHPDQDNGHVPITTNITTNKTIDHTSRDVTPTPELYTSNNSMLKEKERVTMETSSFSMPHFSDSVSNHSLPVSTPKCDDSDHASISANSSTPPLLPSSSNEVEGMKLPPHRPSILDSDIETSSVVSVQQLTDAYLNDPFDSAEEQLTTGTNTALGPISLPPEVTFTRKSHTPTPVENKTLVFHRSSSESTDYHKSVTPEPSKLPPHLAPLGKHHGSTSLSASPIRGEKIIEQSILSKTDKPLPPVSQEQTLPISGLATNKPSPHTPRQVVQQSIPISGQVNKQSSPSLSSFPEQNAVTDKVHIERSHKQLSEPDDDQSLREQLTKALQARANLEGQLDSVVNECKNTLKDRANLQSKLSRAEARISDLVEELESEKQKKLQTERSQPISDHQEQLKEELKSALDKEKMASTSLVHELADEKELTQTLDRQLAEAKTILEEHKELLAASKKKLKDTQNELDKKKSELNSEQSKSLSLETGYKNLEEFVKHQRSELQKVQDSKHEVQRELADTKTNALKQTMEAKLLMEENAVFQDQITKLQRAVLQDKARIVSELEAIEADVLSREDSFEHLLAEKEELKSRLKMSKNTIDQMNSELAKAIVDKEETEKNAAKIKSENKCLAQTVEEVKEKLQTSEQALLDSELQLERSRSGLHEQSCDTEAALASKDSTIQSLKDASEILKQELDMTKDSRTFLEAELEEVKHEVAMMEEKLKSALEENKSILRGSEQTKRELAAENTLLSSQLAEKNRLLLEKDEELKAFESQSDDLIGQFKDIQNQFQSISSERGNVQDNMEEKDRVISHLAAERDSMESELISLREANERLDTNLTQLKQEKARLEGKLDTSPSKSLEEFQKLLQDKSRTQAELNSLKLAHQGELIKTQAKANHLETELRAAKKKRDQTQEDLDDLTKKYDMELSELREENDRLKNELLNASVRLDTPVKAALSPQLKRDLRQAERERDQLKSQVDQLTRQNKHLGEQLEREVTQKSEVERAGTIVAKKLKQNAQENERKLHQEIQDLQLRVEKLTGQLTGMELTQSAMRDHTGELEVALAKREAALLKLSAQAQRILEEKELEDQATIEKMKELEKQLQASKQALRISKEVEKEEKAKTSTLKREMLNKESRLKELKENISEINEEIEALKETICDLTSERDTLLSTINDQAAKVLAVEIRGKEEQRTKEVEIDALQQALTQVKGQLEVAENEKRLLREQLQRNDEPGECDGS